MLTDGWLNKKNLRQTRHLGQLTETSMRAYDSMTDDSSFYISYTRAYVCIV